MTNASSVLDIDIPQTLESMTKITKESMPGVTLIFGMITLLAHLPVLHPALGGMMFLATLASLDFIHKEENDTARIVALAKDNTARIVALAKDNTTRIVALAKENTTRILAHEDTTLRILVYSSCAFVCVLIIMEIVRRQAAARL